ncbi:hypothetical protein [Paraburkholderia aspalathi]|uniref:Uncharacterized protein n=1 Tax=Paraburkholderia aspalathi TaxID=1324617 RepID=A0A1I7EQT6_9BURK|nr:hypothetical protein [Paraburkholderia aspalathi]SFU26298.1 hypothetical protein SAMN05192563_105133 [Paraburkholderia aspalathi]
MSSARTVAPSPAQSPTPVVPPRLPGSRALIGMLAAPFAWAAQMGITEALAAQTCFPRNRPLTAPTLPWLDAIILAVNGACLVLGCCGAFSAWRNVRFIRRIRCGMPGNAGEEPVLLDSFLAQVGAMSSALFMFALIATDIVVLIVSPCRW